MKKVILMLLALTFLITASACSNSNGQTADNSSSVSAEQSSKVEESSSLNATSNQTVTTSKQQNTTSTQKPESSSSKKPESSSSKPTASNVTSIIIKPIETISKPSNTTSTTSDTQSYRFETVQEMCESPELKEQVDALNNSFSSLGLGFEIVAEGNKIVYLYTFLNPIDAEATKPALESGIEAQKETFNQSVRDIQSEIKEKVVLCIRYLNADGTVICQAEFPQ